MTLTALKNDKIITDFAELVRSVADESLETTDILNFFQLLEDTGLSEHMHLSYQNMCKDLVKYGLIARKGENHG